RHDRDFAAVMLDKVLRKLGQKLSDRAQLWPVRPTEETHFHTVRFSLYHSSVRRRPARRSVFATNPNARVARLVSRHRRGCPLGFEVSHTIRPRKPINSATSATSSFVDISVPVPTLTGSMPSKCSVASTIASPQSSTYRNSRVADPSPPQVISSAPCSFASRHLRMSAGITCDDSRSKLSPGP